MVEVMGRECGYISIQVALAAGAEEMLVPELGYDLDEMLRDIEEGRRRGKFSGIIVVVERINLSARGDNLELYFTGI